jgi:hypothetical protein
LVTYRNLSGESGGSDIANCDARGGENVVKGSERVGNGGSVQGWGCKREREVLLLLLSVDALCEVLKLVDLLALHALLVLLDLALLGRGHGKDRLSRHGGSEESLELHFCGVDMGIWIKELV